MTKFKEEDTPDVNENEREQEIIGIPSQPDWPMDGGSVAAPPIPPGLLRDPEIVRLEHELEELKAATVELKPIEATFESGENHKELMEMLGGIFVQLSRIYDTLLLSSEYQQSLDTKHSEGELYGSPPMLKEEAWE